MKMDIIRYYLLLNSTLSHQKYGYEAALNKYTILFLFKVSMF